VPLGSCFRRDLNQPGIFGNFMDYLSFSSDATSKGVPEMAFRRRRESERFLRRRIRDSDRSPMSLSGSRNGECDTEARRLFVTGTPNGGNALNQLRISSDHIENRVVVHRCAWVPTMNLILECRLGLRTRCSGAPLPWNISR
jgi:hypothetical protein